MRRLRGRSRTRVRTDCYILTQQGCDIVLQSGVPNKDRKLWGTTTYAIGTLVACVWGARRTHTQVRGRTWLIDNAGLCGRWQCLYIHYHPTMGDIAMSINVTFSVKRNKDGESHKVVATVPSYDEASEQQRRNAYDRLFSASSGRVLVQSGLRRDLKNNVKPGEELDRRATERALAVLNDTSAGAPTRIYTMDLAKEPFASMDEDLIDTVRKDFERQGFNVIVKNGEDA